MYMAKRRWKAAASFFLAAALTVSGAELASPISAQAETRDAAATYYIDAANGDDANNGTSEGTAWKTFANLEGLKLTAGQKVLLKAGCTWNEEKLMIKDAKGTAANPVVLGKYGEGADPVLNGNGSPWLDGKISVNSRKKEDVAVVHVQNSEYITIQNLEVTNWENDASDLMGEKSNSVIYDQSKSMLTGILVENHDAGELKGVVIKDNYVHDVNGYMSQNGTEGHKKGSGGIMALVTGGNTESYYTDLKITGNKVEKVCHEAIYMESCWAARTLVGGSGSQQAGSKKWVGWPNVYVAHNYVNNVAGDGIVLINADGGVAEYNLVTASASEQWNYSRNPAHAAIWMWDCNNVTMQYNEAAYTTSYQDGMAFDCDYGNQNVMYQYNYSHDNKGGFWMACPGPYYTVNSVIRYNVSVNDGLFDGSRIIRVGERGSIGHQVHNNTIIWDGKGYEVNAVEQGSWGTPPTSGTDIYNNIFCGNTEQYVNNEGIHYSNNCVWGGGEAVYPLDEDENAIVADPGLVDVAKRTDGAFKDYKVTLGSAEGLKLRQDSPCVNAGKDLMAVPEESLPAVEEELVKTQITLERKDYEGNAVPYPSTDAANRRVDIGAFEYQGDGTYAGGGDTGYLAALVNLASSYQQKDFTPATWSVLQAAVNKAKSVLESSPNQVPTAIVRLENALMAMVQAGEETPGGDKVNILASYGGEKDNAGFESSSTDWGEWQGKAEVSTEQARTGNQSLKLVQAQSGSTAYSEIGNVPVEQNTDYSFEAWVYCGDADITSLGLEAKHHNNVTGNGDYKLANMTLASDAEADEKGWRKAAFSFKTAEWDKISISLSSNTGIAYMDDAALYKEAGGSKKELDRTSIDGALALVPDNPESYYSAESWKNFKDKALAARLERVDALATQESIDLAASQLRDAFYALEKGADKRSLQLLYNLCADKVKGNYSDASWKKFQEALRGAKAVLDKAGALQDEIDRAFAALESARDALAVNAPKSQKISYTKAYEKAYKSKAFKLNAKIKTGNGKLSYASSDKKVATVSKDGKVTVKGIGVCTITVKASATSQYKAASVKVKLTVKPQKPSVKSAKAVKGRKLTVSWKKDSKASGYVVQCSLKKNFKSGVKKLDTKKASKTSASFSKLSKGKKYYVRIRTYKTVKVNKKSTKIYSDWSSVKVSGKIK
jgi:hypothetical protein